MSARFDALAEAIVHINAHRQQSPINGDNSNHTLGRVMKQIALISGDSERMEEHIEVTKRNQRELWDRQHAEFHARYKAEAGDPR